MTTKNKKKKFQDRQNYQKQEDYNLAQSQMKGRLGENIPIKTASGTNVILPERERKRLEEIGKVAPEYTTESLQQQKEKQKYTEEAKKKIMRDPSKFGLLAPNQEIQQPDNIQRIEEQQKPQYPELQGQTFKTYDEYGNVLSEIPMETAVKMGLVQTTTNKQQATNALQALGMGAAASPLGLGIAAGAKAIEETPVAWKIGKEITTNEKTAVKLGTKAKHVNLLKTPIEKIAAFSVGIWGLVGSATRIADFFTRKVDDQQQAMNTIGQITSSIVGDSTTGAGDWKEGLNELNYLRSSIIELESAMQAGKISNWQLRYNGQIVDINADIWDQLSTIDEGIRDIRSFALQGQFSELTPFETQQILRDLAAEGYIEPVNLAKNRRKTTWNSGNGLLSQLP